MKTKFNGILTLLVAFIVQFSFAQQKNISGIVSDESGPLPGVGILIKGTTKGVETDFDGKYSIKASIGDILSFSYIQYITVEKTIGSSSIINVKMKEDKNMLDEIVVTALGIKRDKASLGFAQQSVATKNLVRTRETDISTALAGKVAGVQFQGSPSSGFGNSRLRIRGNTGVAYIVNGIRVNASVDVNTEDIDNISILKGAAATTLYGPTAGNGVIIITTKKAKKGQSSITLNASTSFDKLYLLPDYQNKYGEGYQQKTNTPNTFKVFKYDPASRPASWVSFDGDLIPEYTADESWGPKLDGRQVRHWDSWIPGDPEFGKTRAWLPNPNNVRDYFRTAFTNNVSLTFDKGGKDYSIRSSISKINKELIFENAKRNQVNASINAEFNINDKLKATAFLNFQDRKTNNSPINGYNTTIAGFNQWFPRQLD
ncbi:MAG: carboxypeptidase-like regulatory domain-containing protein, partial [Polaribacter sp.]